MLLECLAPRRVAVRERASASRHEDPNVIEKAGRPQTGRHEQAGLPARLQSRRRRERVGIDEALVSDLVEQFYQRVREHARLGPIFDAHVDDWPKHLGKMKDFWGAIAIESGRYRGNPMLKHAALPEARRGHFADWLGLWRETVADLAPSEQVADFFTGRADRISESLQMGIAMHRDGQAPGTPLRD